MNVLQLSTASLIVLSSASACLASGMAQPIGPARMNSESIVADCTSTQVSSHGGYHVLVVRQPTGKILAKVFNHSNGSAAMNPVEIKDSGIRNRMSNNAVLSDYSNASGSFRLTIEQMSASQATNGSPIGPFTATLTSSRLNEGLTCTVYSR